MKWNPEIPAPSGEMPISTVDRQGRQRIIDLEVERLTVQGLYSQLGLDIEVPRYSFPKEIVSLLRTKMEMRPFETLLWVPEKAQRPAIERLIPPGGNEHYMTPEFDAGLDIGALASGKPTRPQGPYLLFTTSAPRIEEWTKGKKPEELRKILAPLHESGLTLDEYLLLERLAASELDWQDENGERMDKRNGVMLLGTRLTDGRTPMIHNTPAGQMTFGAAAPDASHPNVGARVGLVIPLEQ
ncbi:MAG: hypothetical protein AAB692_03230 [Patescibacteria group bacterium]